MMNLREQVEIARENKSQQEREKRQKFSADIVNIFAKIEKETISQEEILAFVPDLEQRGNAKQATDLIEKIAIFQPKLLPCVLPLDVFIEGRAIFAVIKAAYEGRTDKSVLLSLEQIYGEESWRLIAQAFSMRIFSKSLVCACIKIGKKQFVEKELFELILEVVKSGKLPKKEIYDVVQKDATHGSFYNYGKYANIIFRKCFIGELPESYLMFLLKNKFIFSDGGRNDTFYYILSAYEEDIVSEAPIIYMAKQKFCCFPTHVSIFDNIISDNRADKIIKEFIANNVMIGKEDVAILIKSKGKYHEFLSEFMAKGLLYSEDEVIDAIFNKDLPEEFLEKIDLCSKAFLEHFVAFVSVIKTSTYPTSHISASYLIKFLENVNLTYYQEDILQQMFHDEDEQIIEAYFERKYQDFLPRK